MLKKLKDLNVNVYTQLKKEFFDDLVKTTQISIEKKTGLRVLEWLVLASESFQKVTKKNDNIFG